jgi:hypothetical protein
MILTNGYTGDHDQLVPHNLRARDLVRRVFRADQPWYSLLLRASHAYLAVSGVRWTCECHPFAEVAEA